MTSCNTHPPYFHTSVKFGCNPNIIPWWTPSYQSLLVGGLSGGFGPHCNNPLDVVKPRLQKQVTVKGKSPKNTGLVEACIVIAKEEGFLALWKGITPRLLRIMPGQVSHPTSSRSYCSCSPSGRSLHNKFERVSCFNKQKYCHRTLIHHPVAMGS
jgi:hypothetical protein